VKRHLSTHNSNIEALKFVVRRQTHSLSPSPAIHRNLAINGNRYESIALDILELNNLMPSSCELSPPAWFLRVLFDRGVLPSLYGEYGRS
jgi:hypothetical protein